MYRLFQCLISACKLTSRCSIPHSTCFSLEGGGAVAETSPRFELAISKSSTRIIIRIRKRCRKCACVISMVVGVVKHAHEHAYEASKRVWLRETRQRVRVIVHERSSAFAGS